VAENRYLFVKPGLVRGDAISEILLDSSNTQSVRLANANDEAIIIGRLHLPGDAAESAVFLPARSGDVPGSPRDELASDLGRQGNFTDSCLRRLEKPIAAKARAYFKRAVALQSQRSLGGSNRLHQG